MRKQNQTLRRRQRQVGLGLQAAGHQHERPFREARKIATMGSNSVFIRESQMKLARWWLI